MFSNSDHDYRARQDLKGDDKFRYENGLMNNNELRNLEARYDLDDASKRLREEEERRREDDGRNSTYSGSSYSGSSYSGGSYSGGSYSGSSYSSGSYSGGTYIGFHVKRSQEYLEQAYYYSKIANNPRLPQKTRQEAAEKVKMYTKKSRAENKKSVKRAKKDYREASKGSVWGVIIVLVILYFVFFS
ncbi:MAG: hypothetical protein HDT43_08945 [Ruminococcaceae bacterium]|nr:hypothetical protein [Oscillospiraceae bacterium]